jgi:hypothetical protein
MDDSNILLSNNNSLKNDGDTIILLNNDSSIKNDTDSKINIDANAIIDTNTRIKIIIKPKKITETVICDKCGFSYKKNNKSHHMNTKKHSESININKFKANLQVLIDKL